MSAPHDDPRPTWVDNHCHLPDDGLDELLAEARTEGVVQFVDVGVDLEWSTRAIARAAAHPDVHATAGVHPHEARHGIDGLEALLSAPEVVAVGECGLDFHYDHSPRDVQAEVFAAQIGLAHQHRLPLVIHTREAWAETFDILAAEGVPERTVFHCFTGGPDEARRCLDLGAMLSFSGIVTFPSAGDLRDAAALTPIDRLLVETDSPYLAPVPHRGKRNRPAWVSHTGARVAEVVGRSVVEVAASTTENARATYGLGVIAPGPSGP